MIVDNGSTDGTPDVARGIAEEQGAADRLEVHAYPFSIARCGAEHLATPAAVGAQPRLLLQLVLRARAHALRAQVGRRHGAHRRRGARPARPLLAARGERADRQVPALPALRGRREARVPRRLAAQRRAVGLAQPAAATTSSRRSTGSCRCGTATSARSRCPTGRAWSSSTSTPTSSRTGRTPTSRRRRASSASGASGTCSRRSPPAPRRPRASCRSSRPTSAT